MTSCACPQRRNAPPRARRDRDASGCARSRAPRGTSHPFPPQRSFRFGVRRGSGRSAPYAAPHPEPKRPSATNSTPSENAKPPPNEHARCAKVGVSQVRKSGYLLTAGATAGSSVSRGRRRRGWWSSSMDRAAAGIQVRPGQVRPGQVPSGQVPSGQVRPGQVQPGSLAPEAPPSFTAWVAVSKDSGGGPGGVGTELWKRPRTRSRHPANCRQWGSTKELAPRTRTRDRGWYRYPGCE